MRSMIIGSRCFYDSAFLVKWQNQLRRIMSNEGVVAECGEETKTAMAVCGAGIDAKSTRQAIVVLGEASESDDDEILTDHSSVNRVGGQRDDRLTSKTIVTLGAGSDTNHAGRVKQYHHRHQQQQQQQKKTSSLPGSASDSLLHKKLREKNATLWEHMIQACKNPYTSTAKDLVAMTQILVKSQSSVQESSTIVRQMTNDLFHLEDKLDIAIDCGRLVPKIDIKVPTKTPVN